MRTLQECDYVTAANLLKCEIEAVKAVAEVESNGSGFQKDGQPKILFERHKFHLHTKGKFSKDNPDISSERPGGYTSDEHKRLAKAIKLDRNAALMSASWGKFQVLGENWKDLGYTSLQEFINSMYASETEHLMSFVRFVKFKKLDDELRDKRWADFARIYNGKNYHINKYDIKMANAYKKYKSAKK